MIVLINLWEQRLILVIKSKLNNSTSMNFLGYLDQRSSYPENKKNLNYINANENNRQIDQINRAEEYTKSRRGNTSMSNLSISHGVNIIVPTLITRIDKIN